MPHSKPNPNQQSRDRSLGNKTIVMLTKQNKTNALKMFYKGFWKNLKKKKKKSWVYLCVAIKALAENLKSSDEILFMTNRINEVQVMRV